ncbi:MAG: MFS transporter [Candidatus Dormibacteria bacterium]
MAWLLAGQLVMFIGIAAVFPIAPIYVERHGGSTVDVAVFVAAPLIANTVVQVPAGRLADRWGRRPLLVWSRAVYAVAGVALFADVGPLWLLGLIRALQGASSGAYVPALRAALVDLSGPERRAQRFAQLQACEMVGLLLGPLLGGLSALWRPSAVFGIAAVATAVGLVAVGQVPETRGQGGPADRGRKPAGLRWWRARGIVVPSLALAAMGAIFSMYDVVWPLYMQARGYGTVLIGLTISIYALPILVLARPGGRLADRSNRRVLMVMSFVGAASCAFAYPSLRALWSILGVGTVEACAVTLMEPTLFAVVADSTAPDVRGRAMGVAGLFQFGGMGVGALLLGAAYGIGERLSFWTGAGLLVLAGLLCGLALPRGRAHHALRELPAPLLSPLDT